MKKITIFTLVLFATISLQACNNGSNGDRAKGGESDTVGNQSNIRLKDSTNGMKDTLKH